MSYSPEKNDKKPAETPPAVMAEPAEKAEKQTVATEGAVPGKDCQPPPKFEVPEKKSKGEKLWYEATYTGIGYMANLLVSLVIWDYFLTGKGRPLLNKVAKGAGSALKATGMNPEAADKVAMTASEMACSPLGGHLTMIPVKIAEDHARYLTHRFNQQFDPNYQYKDLQANWDTPDSELPPLKDEPTRNTWGQIAMRRGLGWSAVIASGTALNKLGWDLPLQNATEKVVNAGLTHVPGGPSLMKIPTFQRYTRLAALDMYFTAVTSAITALTKKTFGQARDNTVPDDALSIDIPGVTELAGKNGNGKPALPPCPPEQKPLPAEEKENSFAQQIAAEKTDTEKPKPMPASMTEKVIARRQAIETDTSKHLGA